MFVTRSNRFLAFDSEQGVVNEFEAKKSKKVIQITHVSPVPNRSMDITLFN